MQGHVGSDPMGKAWRSEVVLPPGLPVAGEILTSHIRSIDTQARPIRYAGTAVPPETAQLVLAGEAERVDHDLTAVRNPVRRQLAADADADALDRLRLRGLNRSARTIGLPVSSGGGNPASRAATQASS